MEVHDLIRNQLQAGEKVIISAKQEPKLFRFILYMIFGQALVLGAAISVIIMVEDSFVEFWQILADRAAFLPYLLIGGLITTTFLVINTLAKQRFHKELRTFYAFTDKALILIHEASEEYPEPAIGRCDYETITSDNYKYFSSERYIHFFDIVFNNPIFDKVKLYRFYLGHEAENVLSAMDAAQMRAKSLENNLEKTEENDTF